MNIIQRIIVAIGALGIVVMCMVPPWVMVTPAITFSDINFPERYRSVGYATLWDPYTSNDWLKIPDRNPKTGDPFEDLRQRIPDSEDENIRTAQLDLPRLGVQIVGAFVFTVAGVLCAAGKTSRLPAAVSPVYVTEAGTRVN